MAEPIVTVSGVRGIVGESLTPDIVMERARGFGTLLGGGGASAVTRAHPGR